MTSPVAAVACAVPYQATAAPAKPADDSAPQQFGGEYARAVESTDSKSEPVRGKAGDAKSSKASKGGRQESASSEETQKNPSAPVAVAVPPATPALPFTFANFAGLVDLEPVQDGGKGDAEMANASTPKSALPDGLLSLQTLTAAPEAKPTGVETQGNVAFTVKVDGPDSNGKQKVPGAPAAPTTAVRNPSAPKIEDAGDRITAPAAKEESEEPAKAASSSSREAIPLPTVQHGAAYSGSSDTETRSATKTEAAAPVQEVGPVESTPASQQVREFTMKVGNADEAQATVHVREIAGGGVKVMVHTPNVELTNSLRSELEGLSSRLESAGVKASVTQPVAQSQASSGGSLEHRDSPASGGRPSEQGAARDAEQQGREQRRAKWLDEMEKRYDGQ